MPNCKAPCETISELRHLIVIQQRTLTSDDQGGQTEVWSTFASPYAKIDPVRANQLWHSEQLQHRVTHKITMRFISGLDSDMRISFDSRIFYIQHFTNWMERKIWLEIFAEEGAPA